MEEQELRLYTGHLQSLEDIPTELSNQIKIFLSCNSPGADFQAERDAISSRIIPPLREETKAKYGLELHYMDLMSNVKSSDSAVNEYKAREFRLKELIRAQRLSAGPSFVALLGQRYGNRPIPQLILSDIYELVNRALLGSNSRQARNLELLDKWYIQDENSIPAVHVLQTSTVHSEVEWSKERELLQKVLMFGVELCCKDGSLPPEAYRTYFASELENEIKHGLINGETKSLVFQRNISDLSNYASEVAAMSFTEVEWNSLEEKWQLCADSRQLIDSLKTNISENLEEKYISNYSILWRFDSGVHPEFHQKYIDKLCDDVITKLREQIADAAAVVMARKVDRSRLHREVITHWRKAIERGVDCQGRDKEIDRLINYLKSDDNREFFTLYGVSGSGKTCILSKLLVEMHSLFPLSTIMVARFIGLTQESINLKDLLHSICQQVLACLGRKMSIPIDFAEVLKFFNTLLQEIPSSTQLIVLLDSVSSLLPDFNAHSLQWLPSKLPDNIKFIVSLQPHAHGMFTRIKTELITHNHDNFIEVTPLGHSTSMLLTLHWLQQESMCITNSQADLLKTAFEQCSLPLYVKMVFERVKQWRSFDIIEESLLGNCCLTFLEAFFSELEHNHGKVVVHQAVSYLTASKTGLSDMEMEDLLSLDESVMTHIHSDQMPILRRCPPSVWTKLRNDLEPLLRMKVADEYDVYYWMHGVIKDYAEERYLKDDAFRKQIHYMIADYYLGNWYNIPMPYTTTAGKVQTANRHVLSQPLTYMNILGETHYNRRKYDQVPRHLYLADRLDELNATVMFNYDWLYNKIKVLSLQNILADLSLNPSIEATLLEGALRSAQAIIEENINSMPTELSGRLLPYYHTYPNIKTLIDQCDTNGLNHCALVSRFNYHQVPGSPLQYIFDYTDVVDSLLITNDERFILTKSNNSQMLRRFDLLTGEAHCDVTTSYGRVHISPDNQHLVIVDNEIEKSIKVHDIETGDFIFQLIPINLLKMKDSRKYHFEAIAISAQHIATLITTESTHLCIARFDQQNFVTLINLEGKGRVLEISSNESYVLCNSGVNMITYSLNTHEQICLTQLQYKPSCLVLNSTSTKAFVTDEESHIVTVIHITLEGYTQMVSKISLERYMKRDCILQLTLSHNDQMLLVRGERTIVNYNTNTDKVTAHIQKPTSVMEEFKLPKHSQATKIVYTDAIFSHDDGIIMTSLFRNVQFWDSKTGTPMATTILAPVGIILKIIQSSFQSQVITVQQASQSIQVWNPKGYIMEITSLDRLTSSITGLTLTQDNQFCFATGTKSDEVGVIDMSTGLLTNLLTHEGEIVEIVPVKDGSFLFATIKPSNAEFCNKIWCVGERQIIKEFGQSLGFTASLRKTNTIIHISPLSAAYQAPFGITIFNFQDGTCSETTYDFTINYAISKPFVTADDTYMVLLTADQYLEKEAKYQNPSICAFYLKGRYMHSIIGRNELAPFLDTRYITALVPVNHNNTEIIAIYKPGLGGGDVCGAYGFVSIDLATGVSLRYSDNFMPPDTDLRYLYLTNDGSRCINSKLKMVFAMNTGKHLAIINNRSNVIALLRNGDVVIYYQGPQLIAERISDNKILGCCSVHVDICHIEASNDERTVMVGCVDGTVLSYVLIEPDMDNVKSITSSIASRKSITTANESSIPKYERPNTANTWDQIDPDRSHSRIGMFSAASSRYSSKDKDILRDIRPLYQSMTAAKTMRQASAGPQRSSTAYDRSKTCVTM